MHERTDELLSQYCCNRKLISISDRLNTKADGKKKKKAFPGIPASSTRALRPPVSRSEFIACPKLHTASPDGPTSYLKYRHSTPEILRQKSHVYPSAQSTKLCRGHPSPGAGAAKPYKSSDDEGRHCPRFSHTTGGRSQLLMKRPRHVIEATSSAWLLPPPLRVSKWRGGGGGEAEKHAECARDRRPLSASCTRAGLTTHAARTIFFPRKR